MYFELKSLKFKNIFSYGNSLTQIDFQTGLNSIIGKNGVGKSSAFLDTLFFNLFGIPYRDIKIESLINNINKKKLYTESEFVVGKDTYNLIRCVSPSEIKILKNSSEMRLLSSKKLIQDDIDQIIGTNYNVFRQIICLSINSHKPFITLKSNEKRDIIDNIFGIKIYANMLKVVKKDITSLKVENQITLKSISSLQRDIEISKTNINHYKESLSSFEEDKSKTIRSLETLILQKESLIDLNRENSLKLTIEKNRTLLKDKDKVKQLSKTALIKKSEISSERSKLLKELSFFKENLKCTICDSDLTESHRKIHIDSLNSQLDTLKGKLEKILQAESKLDLKLESFQKTENSLKDLSLELTKVEYSNKTLKNEIKTLKDRISEESSKSFNFNLKALEEQLEEKIQELEENSLKNDSIEKSLEINYTISEVLSDKGIKAYFFKNLLPILNSKVNFYLDLFELPVRLEFNELMEETLISTSKKLERDYNSFSEGEKKRIDLSILLSFIDTTKAISNWDCNVIFFDEILDNSIDSEGLEKILESLKGMCYSSRELCIYVITHKHENMDIFDHIIRIRKDGDFSKIDF